MKRIIDKRISVSIGLSNIRRYDEKGLVKYKYVYNMKIGKDIIARNQVIYADNEKILMDLVIQEIIRAVDYWRK